MWQTTLAAGRMGETQYARMCERIARRGGEQIVARLYNGEYFVHRRDPQHPDANGSGSGCELGQVHGQSWAFQLGLPRILPVY